MARSKANYITKKHCITVIQHINLLELVLLRVIFFLKPLCPLCSVVVGCVDVPCRKVLGPVTHSCLLQAPSCVLLGLEGIKAATMKQ